MDSANAWVCFNTSTAIDTRDSTATAAEMHGFGVYTWAADDSTYYGEWQNNSQNGCGVKLYGSGALEVGEWKDDQYLVEYTVERRRVSKTER